MTPGPPPASPTPLNSCCGFLTGPPASPASFKSLSSTPSGGLHANPTVCLFSDDSLHPQDKELPPRVALMESDPAHLYLPTPFKHHTPDLSVSLSPCLSLQGLCPSCSYSRSCPSLRSPSTDHTAAPFSSQGVSWKPEMSHVLFAPVVLGPCVFVE